MFYEKPNIIIRNGKATHGKPCRIKFGQLNTINNPSNYLWRKHFSIYIDRLDRAGAGWNDNQGYAASRIIINALNYFFDTNIDRESLIGRVRYHSSLINPNDIQTDNNGNRHYEFNNKMHLMLGFDCGKLYKTPIDVLSALIGLCQMSWLYECHGSLFNALQILLSYLKDNTMQGREMITKLCNEIGKTGYIQCYSKNLNCNINIPYIAHAQGDLLVKNGNINMSTTVNAQYGATQGFIYDKKEKKKRGFS